MNPVSDFQNSKWRIQYGGRKFWKIYNSYENRYIEVLKVADYESVVRFAKFKMADIIWLPYIPNDRFYDHKTIAIDLKVWKRRSWIVRFTKFKMADPMIS